MNRKAVNDACRAELGRLPLKLVIEKRILSYLLHSQSLDTENLASKAYKFSVSLAMQNKTSYTRNISKMFDSYGMTHETENLDLISKPKITSWMLIFKDKYISHWKNKIKNTHKLSFYSSLKENYQPESYFDVLQNKKKENN